MAIETTGLLLLTYRYLDPATGRFLTRDPAGCEASVNMYAYVGNRVVNRIDPSGLCTKIGKNCYGWDCHGDPDCPPAKPRPKPKPAPPKNPPAPAPPDLCRPIYTRPCPPGQTCWSPFPCQPVHGRTWPFLGLCIGSPGGCLTAFNPMWGGEPMRDLCLDCCEQVGNGLGWSWQQRSQCDNACLLYGLPS